MFDLNKKMRLTTIMICCLVLNACRTNKENPELEDLPQQINSIIAGSGFNGVIFVAKDSLVWYAKAEGLADFETGQRLGLNDQFVIGSVSKQITAVLVLQEFEKGTLKLEDKLGEYLGEIDQAWANEISIHQLLVHTHGITALNQPLAFEPVSQFQYSQLGYDLLARILEKVANRSFEDISSALFLKHGLSHTFHPEQEGYTSLVKGYTEEDNAQLVYASNSLQNYPAAGSFISTAGDLIKWNYLLHSHQLVRSETLALMKNRYTTRGHPIFGTVEYGYGLLFRAGEANLEIGALGYAPGFVSAAYYYPQSRLNLVVLENTARHLNDFSETFKVHLDLMQVLKAATDPKLEATTN